MQQETTPAPALLRAARAAAGLSQAELAAAAGVHKRAVAGWESGEYRPSAEHARALIAILEGAGVEFLRNDCGLRLRPRNGASHG